MTLRTPRRAIYPYTCHGCRRKRKTFKYARAIRGVCMVCQPAKPVTNQAEMFPADSTKKSPEQGATDGMQQKVLRIAERCSGLT